MKYSNIKRAQFIARPNRFVAQVKLDDRLEAVHVKNTGRCREILQPGVTVVLEESANPNRKMKYSLICVYKGSTLINIDSQVPNSMAYEAVKNSRLDEFKDISKLYREVTYGNSRFDLYFETPQGKGFIEVKGVTLESDGVAMFPDAPTERGTKHVMEMVNAVENGYRGYILFVIQMKGIKYFTPNKKMDPEFSEALKAAGKRGVKILAYDSIVTEDEIIIGDRVEVVL